jgi:hypothetical protein
MLRLILGRFYPKECWGSVFDVDYGRLYARGKRGIIFDIDNTLAVYDEPKPSPKVKALLSDLRRMGFRVGLLSNNGEKRVERFNRELGLPAVHRAGKPRRAGIRRAVRMLGLRPPQVVLVGDQLFTDVWGGNRCGVHTVLVEPIALRDEWTVWLKRGPERILKNIYFNHTKGKGHD